MGDKLIAANGSVQGLKEVPSDLKAIYKTVWEISQKTLIDMAAERGRYVDQSMSFNIHMISPSIGKLTSMHFYGWKKGLKTGMYYLRSKAAANAIQFTVNETSKPMMTSSGVGLGGDNLGNGKENQNPVVDEVKKEETDDVQEVTNQVERVQLTEEEQARLLCSLENKEACMMCSG